MSGYHYERPVPPRRTPQQIADYTEWARFTRALMGWTDITADGDTRPRQLARQQAAEARSQPPPGPPAALPADIRIPVPRQAPCPGEFGPGGKFREHCHPAEAAP